MSTVEKLLPASAESVLPELIALLQDAVAGGASIGFLHPLSNDAARRYWEEVVKESAQGSRLILLLRDGGRIVGTIQLGLCQKPNGLHRAEVQKLLVHTRARRQGFGRALMAAVEDAARQARRTLLYLDTESHQPAELMYRQLGWLCAGEIPNYASTPDGQLHGTTIFYKQIEA